ncbi:hypothetical protein ACFQ88_27555 [Paenibacillus sp. NPDC056579]|uniref:hypothetical protein n=1 Tax=Paenibacillus sp. NPDC056579 TaxID=3345871 RepID=UPI0036C71289
MSSIPVVIFPHCSWEQFPYQKLAAVLQTVRPVYYVTGSAPEPVSWPEALQAVTVDDVPAIFNQPALVIVTHPYWVRTVAALRPHRSENEGYSQSVPASTGVRFLQFI